MENVTAADEAAELEKLYGSELLKAFTNGLRDMPNDGGTPDLTNVPEEKRKNYWDLLEELKKMDAVYRNNVFEVLQKRFPEK